MIGLLAAGGVPNTVALPNYGAGTGFRYSNANLGTVVTTLLPYVYVVGGLLMLVILIWGGIGLMTAGGDQGAIKSGYGRISAALIGFGIIFISYFVVQIVEVVLGVKIL